MSQSPMINLYALLNIGPYVDSASVSAAIHTSRQTGDINAAILDKAEQWLLNPAIRERYDANCANNNPNSFSPRPPPIHGNWMQGKTKSDWACWRKKIPMA